jgi:UDP-N-acetylmuramoylalanine--D-glutamate ligase
MTVEERIKGRKIGVLGMARSGMAAAQLALKMGGSPFVSDSAPPSKLAEQGRQLRQAGILYETGGHSEQWLACDYLIVSPGMPPGIDIMQRARHKGIPIFSELELASWVCPARVVAVTGSNGKTTTTTLIGEMLRAANFDSHVCGNIGRPFAALVKNMTSDSIAVVEVSSFQLEAIEDFRPSVAIILNLTPDHFDRHGDFDTYKKTKYRITENQIETDVLMLNRDDHATIADPPETAAATGYFSTEPRPDCDSWVADGWLVAGKIEQIIPCDDIAICGPHNLQNAAAAVAVARRMGVAPDILASVLRSFPGVEHRLETAGMVAGVTFVNDSKATNVDSVCFALRSIDTPIYLICGGRDKGSAYEPIAEAGRDKVRGIVVVGEAKERIFDALGRAFPTQFAVSLEEAVQKSFEMAHPGETVLLSPGCASFDMFDDYEHRGRVFKEAVAMLKNGKNSNEKVSG